MPTHNAMTSKERIAAALEGRPLVLVTPGWCSPGVNPAKFRLAADVAKEHGG